MARSRLVLPLLVLALAWPAIARALEPWEAGPLSWRLSGYVKSFSSLTQGGDQYRAFDLTDRESFWDNTTRARLRGKMMFGDVLALESHYELVNTYGDANRLRHKAEEQYGASPFGEQIVEELFPDIALPRYFDLEHEIVDDESERLVHRLDRLFLRAYLGPWDFTIGRATLTWGPGRFWNPTDYFAAFSPTEIDKEEKPGIDIAHARVAVNEYVTAEAAAAPVREGAHDIDEHGSAAAGRMIVRGLQADWGLSGGWLYDRSVIGLDTDATVGDAGVRAALTRTTVEGVPNEAFYRAMVNADYAFAYNWNPYLLVEYHYNGLGESDPDDYLALSEKPEFVNAYRRGEISNLGQQYMGALFMLQPHALVTVTDTVIVNLLDASAFNGLVVSWSALESLDVQLGAQHTLGGVPSEFGGLENPLTGEDIMVPDVYYAYLKFYY
ncbi:MAG TPA: hypothetical protein PKW95_21500 [bacterium]|nr:hypothetical protein [bacterium]